MTEAALLRQRDHAYSSFTEKLLSRDIQPGQIISQRELTELTGLPLGAIREMIPRLEADGLIRTVPKRGLQVLSIDIELVRNAFQLRSIIEGRAIVEFCRTASAEEIEDLLRQHLDIRDRAKAEVSPEVLETAQRVDWGFHDRIIDALGNAIVSDIHRVNALKIRLIRNSDTRMLPELVVSVLDEHLAILRALRARDSAGALEAIEAHIESGKRRALGVQKIFRRDAIRRIKQRRKCRIPGTEEPKMINTLTRRTLLALTAAAIAAPVYAADNIVLRMSTPASETDQRSVALAEVFAPAVAEFATYEPHYNGSLIAQGSELESIASGDLEMSITSAQELAQFFPEFSIFATGYVHQSADHQVAVFNDELMDPFKQKVEDELGVKLLAVMYLGQRHVNLRQTKDELTVSTPDDLAGVNLRMPGTDAWQFLGKALGANPTPMAFTEVYTALQTGSVDGQDNPLPTVVDAKFYEVTNQVALTSHLVDLNYVAFSREVWDGLTEEQQATVEQAAVAAADSGRARQLEKEESLVTFLKEQGLEIYEPDLAAFREHVQGQYAGSELAADWPDGVLDKINALGSQQALKN